MFFIFGINTKREELPLDKLDICNNCGSYGRAQAFMEYSCFSVFFVPIFKWNKKYFIQMSCCNALYELRSDIGRDLEWGRVELIHEYDLSLIWADQRSRCPNCGNLTRPEYEYCPSCGEHL